MDSVQPGPSVQQMVELDSAINWMASLGVDVDPARQAGYRKIVQTWRDAAQGRSKLGVRELAPMIATWAYEVAAFVAVHRAFGAAPRASLTGLAERLGRAMRGPIRIDGARSAAPDPARDALFEALTAACLQQVASQGKVVHGAGGVMDLVHGRHQVGVRCERLVAHGGIATSLAAAGTRLAPALDAGQGARRRGLVALDASALLKPADRLPQAGTAVDMERAADQQLTDFVDAQMAAIQAGLQALDRRIIGSLVLFSTVALTQDGRDVFQVGRWALVWRDQISFGDADLLGRMRDGLRGGA